MYNILKKHVFIFYIIIYNTSNQYVGFFKWLDLRCSTGITFCVLYCWTNQGFSKLSMDKMIMCDVKWILLMNPQRIITWLSALCRVSAAWYSSVQLEALLVLYSISCLLQFPSNTDGIHLRHTRRTSVYLWDPFIGKQSEEHLHSVNWPWCGFI